MTTWASVPEVEYYLAQVGSVAYERGDVDTALDYYGASLALNPDVSRPRSRMIRNLCTYANLSGDALQAIRWCRLYANMQPLPSTYIALAEALRSVGNHSDAISTLREACSLWPTDSVLVAELALALDHLGSREEAIGLIEKFLRDRPLDDWANYVAGLLYARSGRMTEAYCAYAVAATETHIGWRADHAMAGIESLHLDGQAVDCCLPEVCPEGPEAR